MDTALSATVRSLLEQLGLPANAHGSGDIAVRSPIDGSEIGRVAAHTPQQVGEIVQRAQQAFEAWRNVPAPRRGELIRLLGEELRAHKESLGRLVSIETGKILS